MAVACGKTFCAVATSKRMLRIMRPDGLQEIPEMLPGPVVSMYAKNDLLFVVYHSDEPSVNGTQHLSYAFYIVGSGSVLKSVADGKVPVPLYDKSPLRWVSLADDSMGCMPMFMDSAGMLFGLSKTMNWKWVPLLDTKSSSIRQSKHERIWPVNVSSDKLMAVHLKGKNVFEPKTTPPRPVLSSFELRIPVAGLEESKVGALKHKLEDNALRAAISLDQRSWYKSLSTKEDMENEIMREEAKLDAIVLKHFVLALKLNRSNRALGLVGRLRTMKAMRIAHEQAQRQSAPSALIERIEGAIQDRVAQEELLQEQEDDDEESEEEEEEDDEMNADSDIEVVSKSTKQTKGQISSKLGSRKRTMADDPSQDDNEEPEDDNDGSANDAAATRNPFARKGKLSGKGSKTSPSKPGTKENSKGLLNIFSMKSPQGVITPKLGRQSSFSKEARSSQKKRRRLA